MEDLAATSVADPDRISRLAVIAATVRARRLVEGTTYVHHPLSELRRHSRRRIIRLPRMRYVGG